MPIFQNYYPENKMNIELHEILVKDLVENYVNSDEELSAECYVLGKKWRQFI